MAAGDRGDRRRGPPGSSSAGRVIAVVTLTLLLAALFNAEALMRGAEEKPFGSNRDFWIDVWRPFDRVSDATMVNRPRRWLDDVLNRNESAVSPIPVVEASPHARSTTSQEPAATASSVPPDPSIPAPITSGISPEVGAPYHRLRTPTASEPLRLLVGGDSLSVRFGESLARLAVDSQLMDAHLDSRIATGLARPDVYDWSARLAEDVTAYKPDVVTVHIGSNDTQALMTPDGKTASFGSEAWREEYGRRVGALMDSLQAPHRLVVWVGLPIVRDSSLATRLKEIDDVIRAQASARPDVVFIDNWKLLSDSNGAYAAYLPNAGGEMELVREPDGVHVTRNGGDRIADQIMGVIRDEAGLMGR